MNIGQAAQASETLGSARGQLSPLDAGLYQVQVSPLDAGLYQVQVSPLDAGLYQVLSQLEAGP